MILDMSVRCMPLVRRSRTNDRRRAIMRASSSPRPSHALPVLLWQPVSPHTMCLFDEDAPPTSEILRSTVDHRRCHHGTSSVSSSFFDVIVKSLVRSSFVVNHPNPIRFGPCVFDSLSLDDMRRAKPACSSRLHAAELKASRPSSSTRVLQLMLPTRCGRGHDRSVVLIGTGEKRG